MTETALLPRTTIRELVSWRDQALHVAAQSIAKHVEALALATRAQECAQRAHGGAAFYRSDRRADEDLRRIFLGIDADASLKVFRHDLDARCWTNLMALTRMADLMDRKAKEDFERDLCGEVPEFTEDNALSTFERLVGESRLIFRRGLARAFTGLDKRFRSHDGFKIGTRIILTYVFDGDGHFHYSSRMPDVLMDIERAFAVLDHKPPAGASIIALINATRRNGWGARQSRTESDYFRIDGFKNGNAHLWFTRPDLVEKVNLELADYYGEVLPDAMPREGLRPEDLRSKTGALCKDLSFYPTPPDVVEALLRSVWLPERARVLEPSAGTGAIVSALAARGCDVQAVEVERSRAEQIRGARVTCANFLAMQPRPDFDAVIMNPPFYGTHWMEHVMHAFEFLKPGGQLAAVLPVTAEIGESEKHETFRSWALGHGRKFIDLPPESFAASGTRINTVILTLRK